MVGIGEAVGIDFRHSSQGCPLERPAAALDQRIGRAHPAQIAHQRDRQIIAHGHPVKVRDRQCKARALKQRACEPHVNERDNSRRDAVLDLGLGGCKRLPQPRKRVAPRHAPPAGGRPA